MTIYYVRKREDEDVSSCPKKKHPSSIAASLREKPRYLFSDNLKSAFLLYLENASTEKSFDSIVMALSQRGPLQPVLLAQYPLAKYSYADTASDQYGSISWTHVQSSDLNAIIEKDSIQERLNLRVVRAQEQLVSPNKFCFCMRPSHLMRKSRG